MGALPEQEHVQARQRWPGPRSSWSMSQLAGRTHQSTCQRPSPKLTTTLSLVSSRPSLHPQHAIACPAAAVMVEPVVWGSSLMLSSSSISSRSSCAPRRCCASPVAVLLCVQVAIAFQSRNPQPDILALAFLRIARAARANAFIHGICS